jgi:hypothetical protein
MNIQTGQNHGKSQCSPAQAVAMKNAALKAVLGYLEQQQTRGEWSKDETAQRYRRLVELALEAPCDLKSEKQPRFEIQDYQD